MGKGGGCVLILSSHASSEGVGRTLSRTIHTTRATGGTGDAFLSGVSRSVHAPVGTVVNFAALTMDGVSSGREIQSCLNGVLSSDGRLLSLVGSVLSVDHVRDKGVRLRRARIDLSRILRSLGAVVDKRVRTGRLRLCVSIVSIAGRSICYSGAELGRMLLGLLSGTVGFAPTNKAISIQLERCPNARENYRLCRVQMGSGKVNVDRGFMRGVFSPFRERQASAMDEARNAKLNVTVAGGVISVVNKAVRIRARRNGNARFVVHLPLQVRPRGRHVRGVTRLRNLGTLMMSSSFGAYSDIAGVLIGIKVHSR